MTHLRCPCVLLSAIRWDSNSNRELWSLELYMPLLLLSWWRWFMCQESIKWLTLPRQILHPPFTMILNICQQVPSQEAPLLHVLPSPVLNPWAAPLPILPRVPTAIPMPRAGPCWSCPGLTGSLGSLGHRAPKRGYPGLPLLDGWTRLVSKKRGWSLLDPKMSTTSYLLGFKPNFSR